MLKTYFNFKPLFVLFATFIFVFFLSPLFSNPALSASGINRFINFQGKLVNNPAATNVSNTSYTVIFTIYDKASGGTALWTETQTVTTTDGIFRVALGSVSSIPTSFNFNWSDLYLGMKVNSDAEMTPRVQLAAVPYAFNAQQVAGLTVQDDSGNASTSGTLRVANSKTVTFSGSNGLTFNDPGGSTTISFPSTGSITLVDTATSQTLTNKIIGSTGLTFTGAATDITTGTNEDFILSPNGSGKIGFNASTPLATLDIRGNLGSGTIAIASVSGSTSFATLIANNNLVAGDLFSASSSSQSRFTIKGNGSIIANAYQTCTLKTDSTGLITCGTDNTGGGGGGNSPFAEIAGGLIVPNNSTEDFLIGGQSTATAKFAFVNMSGSGEPTASIAGSITLRNNSGDINRLNGGDITFQTSVGGDLGLAAQVTIKNNGRVGIGTINPLGYLDVRENGTVAIASLSGRTSFATLVIDNSGVGDLFAASVSGGLRFGIKGNGAITATAYQNCTLKTDNTGLFTCGTDNTGGGGGSSPFAEVAGGLMVPNNSTEDFLLGGQSTASARFHFYGATAGQSTTPVASISANTLYAAFVIDNQNKFGDLFTASASGTTRFVVTNQGNVGIGTNTPQAKLDIAGSSSSISNTSGDITIDPAANLIINGAGANGSFGFNTSLPLSSFDIRQNGSIGGTIAIASISGRTSSASLVVNNDSAVGDIFSASASGTTRFRIAQNGSVLFQGQTLASVGGGGTKFTSGAVTNAIGDQGSMLPNAGFESNLSGIGLADGWVAAASNGATQVISRVATTSAKGTASLQIKLNASQSTAFYSTCIPLALAAGLGSYNLAWYAKPSATNVVVRGYIDSYASQLNCMNNNTATTSNASTTTFASTNWATFSIAAINSLGSGTWARAHFFVGCPATCGTATIVNIDAIRLIENSLTGGVDVAENYPGDLYNMAEAGDVVSLKTAGAFAQVVPTTKAYDDSVLGIVSTKPGEVLDDGTVSDPRVPVALAGRVPVKVSTAKGAIKTGDYLSSSTIPGVAVKATKAGPVIGVAMEDYAETDTSAIGKITAFIKNTYYNGTSLASDTGLTSDDGKNVLLKLSDNGSFMIKSSSGSGAITFDQNGNAFFAGTITADKIKANSIDGLDVISGQIDSLSKKVDFLENLFAKGNVLGAATQSGEVNLSTESGALSLNSNNVAGDLNIKGNTLINGMLTVISSITAPNLIISDFASFFGDVIFKQNVKFEKSPTFNSDTAGMAIIKKGDTNVRVNFDAEYQNPPVVTSSIALDKIDDDVKQKQLENTILNGNLSYIVSSRSTKGFTIRISKQQDVDVPFSWVALSIDNIKISESGTPALTINTSATGSAAFQAILNQINSKN